MKSTPIIFILGYLCVVAALGYAGHKTQWKAAYKWSFLGTLIPIGVAAVFAVGLYFQAPAQEDNVSPEDKIKAQLLGIWTHTQTVVPNREPYGWERWTFTPTAIQIQNARPSDLSWGAASTYQYEISRKKTSDTGEWYWHVRVKDTALNAGLVEGKSSLQVFRVGGENNYELRKQDKDLSR